MSWYENLFVNEHTNRLEIDRLKLEVAGTPDLAPAVQALEARVDRTELLLRALITVLEQRGLVGEADLAVAMQQVDLLDGVEDGRVSPAVHERAPTCGACGRYVNPRRAKCVYCAAEVRQASAASPPLRRVQCARCAAEVLERQSYFSTAGVVCEPCFAEVEG